MSGGTALARRRHVVVGGVPRGARRLWLPVAAYLLLTLVLPALHGGWRRPEFWRHAGWILAVSAAVLAMLALARIAWRGSALAARRAIARRDRRTFSRTQAGELS